MNAKAETQLSTSLAPEWQRIELLTRLLNQARNGQAISQEQLQLLNRLQSNVEDIRRGSEQWRRIGSESMSFLEMDILICTIAPEAEPRIGWMFQALQSAMSQQYPTAALLQELFAITPDESVHLYTALAEDSFLRSNRMIELEGNNPFLPIRPSIGVVAKLLNRPLSMDHLSGTIRVRDKADWTDLILPSDCIAMLKEFLLWIQYRNVVVNEWGGRECGGPIALFSGPSGTGKTFAAAVLANELGWPVYRVDLGCLVSKYIGETEKNLNRLFDTAHGQPVMLQFDEADSLFSRRGEVKEARDRYANMEVSHLLARIESHQGPIILTTNMRKHLDAAFARRFQIVVDFPRPDRQARTTLWERLLPQAAPRLEEVNFSFLGEAVNLTGGNIRNAALHSAYLAAKTGEPINLNHVALAVWRELGKDGRERSLSDAGPLAKYLPREVYV